MTVPTSNPPPAHSDADILAAQARGRDDYQRGVSRRGTPYPMPQDPVLCDAWIRGYNMARTERAREIARANAETDQTTT